MTILTINMAESELHRNLIQMISEYITYHYNISRSVQLVDGIDSGVVLKSCKPDIFCEVDDQLIIGEAKIGSDIENDHTAKQFEEYLNWCMVRIKEGYNVLIIYGVPSEYLQTANNYLRCLRTNFNMDEVPFLVITPMGQSFSDKNDLTVCFKNEKPLFSKVEAFKYQKDAVEKIKDKEYAAIFHEQGLGKTKIAIDLMLFWFNTHLLDSVVIVTKKSLLSNWKRELNNLSNLSVIEVSNSRKNNYYAFNLARRIILTSFDSFLKEADRFEQLTHCRQTGIIIDESAKIKNPNANISKVLFKISYSFKRRVIMSGTPIANRPYDIWSQIYFLDHGASLGDNFTDFKKKTNLDNKLARDKTRQIEYVESISSIFEKINNFTVRETKNSGIINLPPKEYFSIDLYFELNQKTIYDEICRNTSYELVRDGISVEDDLSEVIKRLTRLVEATSNPVLIDESYGLCPSKLTALNQLLDEIDERGEKTIVWTSFIKNVDIISKKISRFNPVTYSGEMSSQERDASIKKFIEDSSVRVLVTTYAAKEGLTLTVANNAIFYDRTFNLDDYLQAQDRIHRISQKEICHIYNLRIVNSIDEWIDSLIECKSLSAKLAQGDITKEEYNSLINYSFGEIVHSILGDINGL